MAALRFGIKRLLPVVAVAAVVAAVVAAGLVVTRPGATVPALVETLRPTVCAPPCVSTVEVTVASGDAVALGDIDTVSDSAVVSVSLLSLEALAAPPAPVLRAGSVDVGDVAAGVYTLHLLHADATVTSVTLTVTAPNG
jgi:hypothetical protein